MSNVIVIDQLTKRFGNKTAVDGLSLNVPAGAIYALLGDNGAGKSTTIRVLTGQYPPDSGRASILGLDSWANAIELRHRVGYVPERPRFYDWMTVENIGWFVGGFHKSDFLSRYRDLIHYFRLEPQAKLKNLSKGGYAKVGLALALAINPEVLILDEPTSGLDLLTRREFLSSMVDLAGAGRTIFICSHQIAEVERIASHVAILNEGRLILSEPMEELKRRFTRLRLRYEGTPPDASGLGTVLERNGAGRQWQALIRDPRRDAIETLRIRENVFDFEENAVTLEEIYASLLARPHDKPMPRMEPVDDAESELAPEGKP
ncbi:MAG TPA: ABC transporter ATP-binding protein [Gemmataceae bacterium]|jgi:ABC-2 type transport system ATP-binding protein|nr:ABC transporter ATP-binding protein [Gemmataceae bacterium]